MTAETTTTAAVVPVGGARAGALNHVHRHLVAANWQLIALLESDAHSAALGAASARKHAPLERWSRIPGTAFDAYTRGRDQVRVQSVLDYIQPGDRVLDVGIGYGYVSGVLMRDSRLDYYCGLDVDQRYLDSTDEMTVVNGLEHRDRHLELRGALDVTGPFVDDHRPDLVLLLDVLEHLPDAPLALHALAASMPLEAHLLFTAPLSGGPDAGSETPHRFTSARVRQMCREAGFAVQYVQPLINAEVMVLVSRTSTTTARTLAVLDATPIDTAVIDPEAAPLSRWRAAPA